MKNEVNLEVCGVVERAVLLVSLDWTRDKDPRIPLGHGSLLAALGGISGVEVVGYSYGMNLASFDVEVVVRDVLAWVEARAGLEVLVGFGVYVWNDALVCRVVGALKARFPGVKIVLGGPQVSYSGGGLEGIYPDADFFIRGYGEEALKRLVLGEVAVGVHRAGAVDLVQQAEADLEALPSPFLEGIVDVRGGQRFIRWETRRGCKFRCSFCQHREAGSALKKRDLSVERLREELRLFAAHDVDDIAVLDPIFNDGEHYMALLEELLRLGFRGRLSLQCRFEWVTPEFLDLCAQFNTRLEFGLQTIHRDEGRAVRRVNRMGKVEEAIAELHKRDIAFEVSLIFGLPEQTLASFRESVDFCLRHRVPVIKAFPLMLLRGTELEKRRGEWGLRESADVIPMVVESNTFDEQDWRVMAAISEALVATEGEHPVSIEVLEQGVGADFEPGRWSPVLDESKATITS